MIWRSEEMERKRAANNERRALVARSEMVQRLRRVWKEATIEERDVFLRSLRGLQLDDEDERPPYSCDRHAP